MTVLTPNFLIFFLLTLPVILLVEKLTFRVVNIIFKRHLEEMGQEEKKISEYNDLGYLALLERNYEAFRGFQEMASELYWKHFFRKLVMGSSTFFLLLSPYMLATNFLLKDFVYSPFSAVFVIAIIYFMTKTVYYYAMDLINTKREIDKLRTDRECKVD
ncbi:MAG: hypothetical protein ACLFVX_06475 [Archaeoglobaceae archaeon]